MSVITTFMQHCPTQYPKKINYHDWDIDWRLKRKFKDKLFLFILTFFSNIHAISYLLLFPCLKKKQLFQE